MLTECDYCDYDTCVALEELGFSSVNNEYFQSKIVSKEIPLKFFDTTLQGTSLEYAPIISLYEAQKWLREEKKLIVLVGFDFCPITSDIVYNWVIVVNGNTAKKSSYTYDYFEEALSEGIKEAIKHIEII